MRPTRIVHSSNLSLRQTTWGRRLRNCELEKENDFPPPPPEKPRSFQMIPPVADPQPEYAQIPSPEEHYQKQNSGGEEPEDPFDPGPINPETEPDLCPPLTPIKAMAASAPTAEEISQQQRRKSFLTLLHLHQLTDTVVKILKKDCVV
ncbi:uncharacterized protein FN964_004069 [Alca torda]